MVSTVDEDRKQKIEEKFKVGISFSHDTRYLVRESLKQII